MIAGFALRSSGQGNFQNLDFESASLNPVPFGQSGGFVPITDALPGWTGYIGTNQVSQVLHNDVSLGAPAIDILGPDFSTNAIIAGLFTAVLQPGVNPPNPPVSASIAQTAVVPPTARSIELKVNGTIVVTLAGRSVPLIVRSVRGPTMSYMAEMFHNALDRSPNFASQPFRLSGPHPGSIIQIIRLLEFAW